MHDDQLQISVHEFEMIVTLDFCVSSKKHDVKFKYLIILESIFIQMEPVGI